MPSPLRLGNYEPLLELAAGGMATVYVARQVAAAGFERLVVIKRVHRHLLGDREFTNMFRDEARVASTIRHPNVVAVDDVIESDGELLLVMDYVEGCSLATLVQVAKKQARTFPQPIVVRFLCDMLEGLQAAHEASDMRGRKLEIVHRDVSPQNVLLGVDGTCRLIDFGVAKAAHRLTETKSGSLKGKLSYMAPEQARSKPVDRRTDLFAAGVVAHELLTGQRLFKGEDDIDTLHRILEAPVHPPSETNGAVSKELDAVIVKALQRDPEARFQTAHEMIEALERACRPAATREAAALLAELCSDRLKERSDAIRQILDGDQPPLSMRLATERSESRGPDTVPLLESSRTEDKLSVMQDSVPRPARPTWLKASVIVLGLVSLLALALWTNSATKRAAPVDHPPAAALAPAPVAAAPGETAGPSPSATVARATSDEVEITLAADRIIETVQTSGMHRVEIAGPTARVFVAAYTGTLKVEAKLAGGIPATANVPAGAASAQLVLVKQTAPKRELQSNPYGKP